MAQTEQELEQEQNPAQENPAPEAPKEKEPKKAKKSDSKSQAELAALKTKLEKAEKECAENKDLLMRTAAEYDNFRKRSAKEHDAAFDNGVSFAVTALLTVIDTLGLAAAAETADENYKKGVLLTLDKCKEAFDKIGVKEIEADGKPFDPELHAAVMQQPAQEGVESGTITQVVQKGYLLHDKIVRHAAVIVAE